MLTPDFCGNLDAVARVLDAGPHVFNHNMETIARLYKRVRPQANYRQSLNVLRFANRYRPGVLTKSGLMVGLANRRMRCSQLLRDLRDASCRRGNHRAISAADPAQFAGGRVCKPAAVRQLSRLRSVDRLEEGIQPGLSSAVPTWPTWLTTKPARAYA